MVTMQEYKGAIPFLHSIGIYFEKSVSVLSHTLKTQTHLSLRVLQFLLLLLNLRFKDLFHFCLHLLHFHHVLPALLLHLCQGTPVDHGRG